MVEDFGLLVLGGFLVFGGSGGFLDLDLRL